MVLKEIKAVKSGSEDLILCQVAPHGLSTHPPGHENKLAPSDCYDRLDEALRDYGLK